MSIAIFIITSVLLAWMIFYRFYRTKLEAACNRIQSKGWRKTVKTLLDVSYIISFIIVAVGYIVQVVNLFSKKDGSS